MADGGGYEAKEWPIDHRDEVTIHGTFHLFSRKIFPIDNFRYLWRKEAKPQALLDH